MPLPTPDPASLPAHVLFPEDYRRTARMITQDFILLGGILVAGIVGAAFLSTLAPA